MCLGSAEWVVCKWSVIEHQGHWSGPKNRPHVEGAPVLWKYERSEIATQSDSSANNQQSHFRRYNNSY